MCSSAILRSVLCRITSSKGCHSFCVIAFSMSDCLSFIVALLNKLHYRNVQSQTTIRLRYHYRNTVVVHLGTQRAVWRNGGRLISATTACIEPGARGSAGRGTRPLRACHFERSEKSVLLIIHEEKDGFLGRRLPRNDKFIAKQRTTACIELGAGRARRTSNACPYIL